MVRTIANLITNKKNGQSFLILKKKDCDFLRNKKKPKAAEIDIERLIFGDKDGS